MQRNVESLGPDEVAVKEGLDIILDFINFFKEDCPAGSQSALEFLTSGEDRKNIAMDYGDGTGFYISLFKLKNDYLLLVAINFDAIETYYKLNYEN